MSAESDLPRGASLSSIVNPGPGTPAVQFPAIPGVSWVLTYIEAILQNRDPTNAYYNFVSTTIGFVEVSMRGLISTSAATGTADYSKDSWTWSGSVGAQPNSPVVVTLSSPVTASQTAILNVIAYPV